MTPSFQGLEDIVRTVYGEARGEPSAGRQAVAWVIVNRTLDPRWPNTVSEVCKQPKQFSCWNPNDPNCQLTKQAELSDPVMFSCLCDVVDMLDLPPAQDPTRGANHYLTTKLATSSPPSWYDKSKMTAMIGNHQFLKL